jgi:4-amino-4-deoxy-L-arabinose transferase-like glycosyltransferase
MQRKTALRIATLLLLISAWFRAWDAERVPPGPHHDEIINGQIVREFIWPVLPAWLRPADAAPVIPWLTLQKNPRGPDLQEHAWLYQVTLAGTLGAVGLNPAGMRLADFIWGMLSVSACYALTRRLFGRRAALLAMAVQAVSFWSVSIARAGMRTGTIAPMLALAGCLFWDAAQRRGGATGRFALAGALFGVSVYGYLSARPMVLVFVALAVYWMWRRPSGVERRKLAAGLAAFLMAAAVVVAPLAIYLAGHPEENLRVNMLGGPLQALAAGRPGEIIQTTLATLGMFAWRGDPQWHYNISGQPILDPVGAIFFIAGLGWAVWTWKQPACAFAVLWLAVSLTPGMLSQPAPHNLRTVAAQAVAFGLVGLGVERLASLAQRARPAVYALAAVWWLGFAVWNFQGYFQVWAQNDEVWFYYQGGVTQLARYLDRSPDPTPVAACSIFPETEYEDFFRSPRQTFDFVLRRRDLAIRWFNCSFSMVIPAGGRARVIFPEADRNWNMLDWSLEDWRADSTPVHDDGAPDGTVYQLDAARPLGEIGALTRTSEVVWSPEAGVDGRAALPIDFGHAVELLGYRVEPASRRPGEDVRVLTYWRVIGRPPMFMTGFAHLLSDPTHILAQHDQQAMLYDTLQPGDVFVQVYFLTIPDGASPGQYRLSVGWYVSRTLRRLTVYDGATPRGDRLMLREFTVRP